MINNILRLEKGDVFSQTHVVHGVPFNTLYRLSRVNPNQFKLQFFLGFQNDTTEINLNFRCRFQYILIKHWSPNREQFAYKGKHKLIKFTILPSFTSFFKYEYQYQ